MFAHKLVAILDRYNKHHSIAGRDLFDLHTFFLKGYEFDKEVIQERRHQELSSFLRSLQHLSK